MSLSADNPDYIFSLIVFFGIFGFCVAVYLILEVLKFMGITKMVIDVATYDTIVSICIAICATVVFSCACALYVLKRAKLL